ncbi:MAG: hypothetical protein A2Y25_09375 [Candidatus Melainabacteria bacterium GWF2_37_15]|nr:MAG: hypothetical protein A2Y25_09375 [Candidatus Melainabacteria bacterium GWF2_37_15]
MFFIRMILVVGLFFNSTFVLAVENEKLFNLLDFDELVELSKTAEPAEELQKELDFVLNNPVLDNTIAPKDIKLNNNAILGDFIRVGTWNIARGRNLDLIKLIFTNPDEFYSKIKGKNLKEIKEQVEILKNLDILLINEADIGMPRTGYKNIPEELAKILGFNYAFGTEFVEVDPTHLGIEKNVWSEERVLFPNGEYVVDGAKYKGLHGNVILSRFPLKNIRIIRLTNYYDWFKHEKDKVVEVEYLRRKAADFIFNEAIFREIRRGSRIALLADVEVPGVEEPLTVISVHLENRTLPESRYKQMKELLEKIKDIKNPIVLGGDLNTTTRDGRPTTIKRELKKKITDPHFVGRQVIHALVPYALIVSAGQTTLDIARKHNNPTVLNVPVVSPNKERRLFHIIKSMKFEGGGRFDYGGQKYRAVKGHDGPLSNSNQRANLKGFVSTYNFDRDWYLGRFKLDWIFVKPCACKVVEDEDVLGRFAPFYARTLHDLNHSLCPPVSDHAPITVDLPIAPPNKKEVKIRKKELKKLEEKAKSTPR